MFYPTDLPAHSVLKMSLSLTGKVIFAISIILKQTKLKTISSSTRSSLDHYMASPIYKLQEKKIVSQYQCTRGATLHYIMTSSH